MTPLGALAAATLAATMPDSSAFAPGEETVMQVRFLGVPSGEGRLTVGQPAGAIWPVIFQVRTAGVASVLDIREHLVSYWDSAVRQTRGFDLRAYEVGDFKVERVRFDRAAGKVEFERQRNGERKRLIVDVPSNAQDLAGAVMWLRMQPLAPGERHEFPVCTGTSHFTFVAEVLARERIVTPMGAFQTVKVQVRTSVQGRFSTKRDSFLWFSDDPRHVLVRMSAHFAVGSIVATLKSYRPGERIARAEAP